MTSSSVKMNAYYIVLIVTVCSLRAGNAATPTKKVPEKEEFYPLKYPGPIQEVGNRYGTEEEDVPPECRNKNYCTIKPPDYPEDEFDAMFKGKSILPQPQLVIDAFGDRLGDPDAMDNCASEITFEPLFKIRSLRGDWRTVIQAPKQNYVQKVRLETCVNRDAPCFTLLTIPSNLVTFCQQKYSVWEFLVSDGNNGTETVQSDLPVCCSCYYKFK